MNSDDLIAAQRHAEIVEQLRRISTGIEIVVAQNDRTLDQLREIVARFEVALKYAVAAWREQREQRPR